MDLVKMVSEEAERKKDKKTWKELMREDPGVRDLLYSSRRLFIQSAKGAGEETPWHISLCSLVRARGWNEKEQEVLLHLITRLLNKGKEESNVLASRVNAE